MDMLCLDHALLLTHCFTTVLLEFRRSLVKKKMEGIFIKRIYVRIQSALSGSSLVSLPTPF